MSLLMDALRRAEADKKAQEERAARATGGEAAASGGAVTRSSPYSNAKDDTVQIDGRALQAAAASIADFDLRIDDNLDHNLAMGGPAGLSLEPLGTSIGNDTDFGAIDRGSAYDVAEFGGNSTFAGRIERREQTATDPAARGLERELDDYLDRPYSTQLPRGSSGTDDSALEQVAAHTVAGAQTVFRAGERPRPGRLLTLAAAITICAVVGIAGLGVYYAGLNPLPRVVPSPDVARGVEKPRPLAPLREAQAIASSEFPAIDTERPAALAAAADTTAPLPAITLAPAPTKPAPRAADRPVVRPRRAMVSAAPRAANEEINSGEVRISRSQTPTAIDASLAKAYAAFQVGDLDAAVRLYGAARVADPGRRDTLLGLAAVALKRGDLARAYDYYAEVLKRQPHDPVASAALFSMTEADGESGAARLRLLLDSHGDAAYIHAALGSWYARRARWADAQQAYFDAVRLDAANPDYSFNLAVSLEHLGQGTAALGYYQKSLSLRAHHGAGFDAHTAEDRIRALSTPAAP